MKELELNERLRKCIDELEYLKYQYSKIMENATAERIDESIDKLKDAQLTRIK